MVAPEPLSRLLHAKGDGQTMIFTSILRRLQGFAKDVRSEEGQAMVEYALLVSLVAVVCFIAVQAFGLGVSHLFSKINSDLP